MCRKFKQRGLNPRETKEKVLAVMIGCRWQLAVLVVVAVLPHSGVLLGRPSLKTYALRFIYLRYLLQLDA